MIHMSTRCALLILSAAVIGDAQAADLAQAARGLGYANYVSKSRRCDGAVAAQAATLQKDISTYYHFSNDDLLGTTTIGAEVRKGRASALNDATHPEYKGQFCDSMDEVLSVWRSNVLPSPR